MKNSQLLVILICGTFAGCGGSGGSTEAITIPAPPPVEVTEDGAAGIQAPTGFDFATTAPLTFEVLQSTAATADSYLTICLPKAKSATADYGKCLLRTSLTEAQYVGAVTLSNDIDRLEFEIWSPTTASIVSSTTWQRDAHGFEPLRIQF